MKTVSQVKQWIDGNLDITVDQVTNDDSSMLLSVAKVDRDSFFQLAAYAFRVRRERKMLEAPLRQEVCAFLLEFRCKILMMCEQSDLPTVPLFDFGNADLFQSTAFIETTMKYDLFGDAI